MLVYALYFNTDFYQEVINNLKLILHIRCLWQCNIHLLGLSGVTKIHIRKAKIKRKNSDPYPGSGWRQFKEKKKKTNKNKNKLIFLEKFLKKSYIWLSDPVRKTAVIKIIDLGTLLGYFKFCLISRNIM